MSDIEQKALALLNEVAKQRGVILNVYFDREITTHEALCRAIEQHEDFKQEVSDALVDYFGEHLVAEDGGDTLASFVIFKPKPDPIAEAWIEATGNTVGMEPLNAALEARGLEIREKGQ